MPLRVLQLHTEGKVMRLSISLHLLTSHYSHLLFLMLFSFTHTHSLSLSRMHLAKFHGQLLKTLGKTSDCYKLLLNGFLCFFFNSQEISELEDIWVATSSPEQLPTAMPSFGMCYDTHRQHTSASKPPPQQCLVIWPGTFLKLGHGPDLLCHTAHLLRGIQALNEILLHWHRVGGIQWYLG